LTRIGFSGFGVKLAALLGELAGFFFHSFLQCFLFGHALLDCVFPNVFRYLDELRLPANLALQMILNVIYPIALA
jgi:hypothetical protein